MLWSRQLDVSTDSPRTVIKRMKANNKERAKQRLMNSKRQSYATLLVEESLEKVGKEEDHRAVEAAQVRRNTADVGILRRSISPLAVEKSEKLETINDSGTERIVS